MVEKSSKNKIQLSQSIMITGQTNELKFYVINAIKIKYFARSVRS